MCLHTKLGKFTTQKPIECYKVLFFTPYNEKYVAPFRNFVYEFGITYETELGVFPSKTKRMDLMSLIKVYFQLHKDKLYKMSLKDFIYSWTHEYLIEEGFHAYRSETTATYIRSFLDPRMVVTRCTIPKGSEVYFNEKEIVSNKIIIDSLV